MSWLIEHLPSLLVAWIVLSFPLGVFVGRFIRFGGRS